MKKTVFILYAVVFFFSFTFSFHSRAAASSNVKKGGVLKVIYGVSPNTLGFGPILQRSDDILAASPAVETLLHVDETGAIEPWLATAFKGDAKSKTIVISLRKGVKFHDGTDFNAEAVRWNLEEYRKSKKPELKKVESIDVIDDYTIRFNLSSYDNGIEYALTGYAGFMVSPAYFKSHGGADGVKNHPVGTGPFQFVSFERDVSLKYKRFDGYWQKGKPYLNGMEFLYIADPMVRLASFQAGEGDILVGVEPQDAKTLEKTGRFSFNKSLGTMIGLAGDGDHPDSPFADIRVRKAIEYAINREPVVKAIGLGYWDVTDQGCAKTSWGYYPGPSPYAYNPKKAKELLTEAGYPNGLNCPLAVRNVPAAFVDLYTAILEQLNEAGFNLHLDIADPSKFNEYVIKTGWNNTLLGYNFSDSADASRIQILGFSSFGFPYRSIKHYEEIDNVIREITRTDDFKVKKAKTQEANMLIRDKYCTVTTILTTKSISARYRYVHDDGFLKTIGYQQSLQDAWMDK